MFSICWLLLHHKIIDLGRMGLLFISKITPSKVVASFNFTSSKVTHDDSVWEAETPRDQVLFPLNKTFLCSAGRCCQTQGTPFGPVVSGFGQSTGSRLHLALTTWEFFIKGKNIKRTLQGGALAKGQLGMMVPPAHWALWSSPALGDNNGIYLIFKHNCNYKFNLLVIVPSA